MDSYREAAHLIPLMRDREALDVACNFMSVRLTSCFLLPLTVLLIIGCKTNSTSATKPMNDTTAALSLLLNKDFLNRHMPGYGGLERPSPFGDTIIFRSDSIINGRLPESINSFHFRFLTEDQICDMATVYHTDTTDFPNFFQLNRFEKRDSTYDIALQVTCVMPTFDKNGRRLFPDDTSSYKCVFGMLCGGGVGVTVYRENDTLKIRKEVSWSD